MTTERFGNNLELNESDDVVFNRRMGVRKYFRELRMHTCKVRDLKIRK